VPETNDFFAPLVHDSSKVVFAVPENLRRRGSRRRASRVVAVAGLAAAVVVVVAIGSTLAFGRKTVMPPGQTTSPSPSASAAPSPSHSVEPPSMEIPLAALLQASDVGTGYATSDDPQGDDHGSILMLMSYCGEGDYSTAAEHRLAYHRRSVGRSEQQYLYEEVNRYEPTWAARHVIDLRAALPRCQTVDIMGDPNHRVTLDVVATDFTGHESLLLRETFGNESQYHAVVRQGDVEARLRIHIGATDSEARAIVVNAAERLCAAVPSC
jgi:hypothetical protein